MRHFEMINVFGNVIWKDPKAPPDVTISEHIPEQHRERLYRLLERAAEDQVSVAVDHMLRKLSQ